MRIPVEGIPATGREIGFGLREGWALDAAGRSLDHTPTTLDGTFELHRANKRGLVRIDVKVRAGAPVGCDRCGEAVDLVVDEELTLLYAPEEQGGASYDGGELELQADDLDIGWYAEGQIDLADVLREAVALSLPTRVTCADIPSCDRRTDALLAAPAASAGSSAFAALAALAPGGSDESEEL